MMAATSGSSIAGAGDAERAKAAAAELVRSAPDVFVVATAPALAELHRLTSTIPIVFTQVGDPLEAGSVASLARWQYHGLPRLRGGDGRQIWQRL